MIERRGASPFRAVLSLLSAAAVIAACSSSKPDTVGPNAPGQSTAAGAPTTTAPTTSAPASADPATTQAITKAYGTFFSGKAAPSVSQAALQHGEKFTKVLEQQAKQSYSQDTTVKVLSILVSGKVADVKFSLFSKGAPLLQNIQGKAVQDAGSWKVAAITFCALLKLQGTPPPACSDASITALPQ